MNSKGHSIPWLVWGGLILIVLLIGAAFVRDLMEARRLDPGIPLHVISEVPEFLLTNQFHQPVTQDNLTGKLWLADIIFTRCPGPCTYMTKRMKELQEAIPSDWPVSFVSLTTDPEYDHPAILNAYARRFGADTNRWLFLTGSKPEIRQLAVQGLKLVLQEKAPEEREVPEDLFIHSTLLVLVDAQGRLRAVFESLPRIDEAIPEEEQAALIEAEFAKIRDQIVRAVQTLMRENPQ